MKNSKSNQVDVVINSLFEDSKNDRIKMMKTFSKILFRPIQPKDFKHVYLSISKEQGEDLVKLVRENNCKNLVEFGTSFGISTLYLAQGAKATGGNIITTELLESKAKTAIENFKKANVEDLIEVRIGDAMETLSDYNDPIDLLLLDGWKDLYHPLFNMLQSNFHPNTIVYVDNADMTETQTFLKKIRHNTNYHLEEKYDGKVVLISMRK